MYQQDGPDPQSNCATFAVEKLMQMLQKIVPQTHRKVKRCTKCDEAQFASRLRQTH